MVGVQNGPDERDGNRIHTFTDEMAAGVAHVFLVHRRVHSARGNHPFSHAAPQIARHQHGGRRIFWVVAIAVFLVAQTNFDAVFVPLGGDQPRLGPLVLDQRIQAHSRAVDAQIGVRDDFGRRNARFFLDQFQTVADGKGRVLRGR